MRKRYILSIFLALTIVFTIGCESGVEEKEDGIVEEEFEVDEEMETKVRGARLADYIIQENFENVRLEDFKINTEIDNIKKINNADFYLYLDNEDEGEVEKIIDEYGEIFAEEFAERESYLGITLYWITPNQDRENAIERDYIQ